MSLEKSEILLLTFLIIFSVGYFLIPECLEYILLPGGAYLNASKITGIYEIDGYIVEVADWKIYSLDNKTSYTICGFACVDSDPKIILISDVEIGSDFFWNTYFHERCHFENPIGQYRENIIASTAEEALCQITGFVGPYLFERPEIVKI